MNINKFFLFYGLLILAGTFKLLDKYGYFDNIKNYSATPAVTYQEQMQNYASEPIANIEKVQVKTTERMSPKLESENNKIIRQLLEEYVRDSKNEMPMKNEDKTTIIDIILNNDHVMSTVITPLSQDQFTSEYVNAIISDLCGLKDERLYIDHGITFTYKFFDLNMNNIKNITIDSNECDVLEQKNTI